MRRGRSERAGDLKAGNMSRGLILEKIKVNLDFLVGWGFFKKTI